jgi:uncharacterized protein
MGTLPINLFPLALMTDPSSSPHWYKEGLRFACTQCGHCCTGSPGYVWLKEEDVEAMSKLLGLEREEFLRRYTRMAFGRLALLEHSRTYDCVFLEGNRCKVYEIRPRQCRTFPWWPEHLTSKEAWEEAAQRCEGINHPEAPLISSDRINSEIK